MAVERFTRLRTLALSPIENRLSYFIGEKKIPAKALPHAILPIGPLPYVSRSTSTRET
jgi:hypothetical protein